MVDVAPEVREFLGEGSLRQYLKGLGPLPCADCGGLVAPDADATLVVIIPADQLQWPQVGGVDVGENNDDDEELILALCHVACRPSAVVEVDRATFNTLVGSDTATDCVLVLACSADEVPILCVGVPYGMSYQPPGQQDLMNAALGTMLRGGFHLARPSVPVPRTPVPGWEVCLGLPPDHPEWAVWLRHGERSVAESGYVTAPPHLSAALARHDNQILVWVIANSVNAENWPARLEQAQRTGNAAAAWVPVVFGRAIRGPGNADGAERADPPAHRREHDSPLWPRHPGTSAYRPYRNPSGRHDERDG